MEAVRNSNFAVVMFNGLFMYCPKCKEKTKVTDSRPMVNRNGILRRRECVNPKCGHKFKTYEEYENSKNIIDLDTSTKRIEAAVRLINLAKNILRPPLNKT